MAVHQGVGHGLHAPLLGAGEQLPELLQDLGLPEAGSAGDDAGGQVHGATTADGAVPVEDTSGTGAS